jgi:hypothetical protein
VHGFDHRLNQKREGGMTHLTKVVLTAVAGRGQHTAVRGGWRLGVFAEKALQSRSGTPG